MRTLKFITMGCLFVGAASSGPCGTASYRVATAAKSVSNLLTSSPPRVRLRRDPRPDPDDESDDF